MKSFHDSMIEYKNQLEKGEIKKAYRGLMAYFKKLRLYFKNKYPDLSLSGAVYDGYMDFTFFHFYTKLLKQRKLKIVILFIHDKFTFEVWLSGGNNNVQKKFWKLFKDSSYNRYHIPSTTEGVEYIVNHTLIERPDFSDLAALTDRIEQGTLEFVKDIESFLAKLERPAPQSFPG